MVGSCNTRTDCALISWCFGHCHVMVFCLLFSFFLPLQLFRSPACYCRSPLACLVDTQLQQRWGAGSTQFLETITYLIFRISWSHFTYFCIVDAGICCCFSFQIQGCLNETDFGAVDTLIPHQNAYVDTRSVLTVRQSPKERAQQRSPAGVQETRHDIFIPTGMQSLSFYCHGHVPARWFIVSDTPQGLRPRVLEYFLSSPLVSHSPPFDRSPWSKGPLPPLLLLLYELGCVVGSLSEDDALQS